jgi:type VI secretion system protein ImpA
LHPDCLAEKNKMMRLPELIESESLVLNEDVNQYIEQHFGKTLDQLLAPIGDSVVGDSVRHNGVYSKIKEARREDDSSLPQGVWTHEMKTADWEKVEFTALEALCFKSKDLQLGVWLMESNINRYGFAGIAPVAVLLRALCETFWDTMHPQMVDGDVEFRTNPINWINKKLSLRLRLAPITATPLDGDEYSWDDWENAQRYEQLKRQHQGQVKWDGVNTDLFKQRLAATSETFLYTLCSDIEDAKRAADDLITWFDQQCGNDSPSLNEMTTLLDNIRSVAEGELTRRGISLSMMSAENSSDVDSTNDVSGDDSGGNGHSSGSSNGGGSNGGGESSNGAIRNRADAFARLREAAEFLMRDDPHSPVPYMVSTACTWGEKSAPDLYQELFLHKAGQLNIFEIMGLSTDESAS